MFPIEETYSAFPIFFSPTVFILLSKILNDIKSPKGIFKNENTYASYS